MPEIGLILNRASGKGKRRRGCVMAVAPAALQAEIRAWALAHIDPADLAPGGFDREPHVTIKHGFKDDSPNTAELVRQALSRHGPVGVVIKGLSFFPDSGDGVVLKADVEGRGLRKLNKFFSDNFRCDDKFPEYKPHLTIAYLRPGAEGKYAGLKAPFARRLVVFTRAVWSDSAKNRVVIDLRDRRFRKAMGWLAGGSGAELVPPAHTPKFRVGRRPVSPLLRSKAVPLPTPSSHATRRLPLNAGMPVAPSLKRRRRRDEGEKSLSFRIEDSKALTERKDRLNRRMCYDNGRRVKCPVRKGGGGERHVARPEQKRPHSRRAAQGSASREKYHKFVGVLKLFGRGSGPCEESVHALMAAFDGASGQVITSLLQKAASGAPPEVVGRAKALAGDALGGGGRG